MTDSDVMIMRKEALVSATITCVGQRGVSDVTVGQIAKQAGVSSALAHHYFGSKDQLFLSAIRSILSEFGRQARAELATAATPRDRLHGIVAASFSERNFQPEVIAAWLNFYVMAQVQPETNRLLRIYQKRLISNLTHALRPLCDTPEATAQTTAALIDGLYIHRALDQNTPPDAKDAIARVTAYLERVTR